MRKLLFILMLVPVATTFTVGCSGPTENKVIQPTEPDPAEIEAAEAADANTSEE